MNGSRPRLIPSRRRAVAYLLAILAAAVSLVVGALQFTPSASGSAGQTDGTMVVRFVDVGQGDATIVEFPDGKTLVVDVAQGGAAAVDSQLAADGRDGIDWLVATHPDSDHIGGIPDVLQANDVRSVWAPEANSSTWTYTRFLEAVDDAGLTIDVAESGTRIAEGQGYTIDILWPPEDVEYEDTNDYSAVILVTYGSTTLLLTGDAPAEALQDANVGHVDVLKVSHHGSASGMTEELAQELSPDVAVISYGLDNDYGHPTQVVLDDLAEVGTDVYGTAANGTVTVTSDGSSVSVACEREGEVEAASYDAGSSSSRLDYGEGAAMVPMTWGGER
jgi:competence protein ComEC